MKLNSSSTVEINDYSDIDHALKAVDFAATTAIKNKEPFYLQFGTDKKMTGAQRGALHVWCGLCADTLNDSGLELCYKSVVDESIDLGVDWTMILFKEIVYKKVLNVMTSKKSTEDQSTVNPSDVSLVITRHFANKGVVLPAWPSRTAPIVN